MMMTDTVWIKGTEHKKDNIAQSRKFDLQVLTVMLYILTAKRSWFRKSKKSGSRNYRNFCIHQQKVDNNQETILPNGQQFSGKCDYHYRQSFLHGNLSFWYYTKKAICHYPARYLPFHHTLYWPVQWVSGVPVRVELLTQETNHRLQNARMNYVAVVLASFFSALASKTFQKRTIRFPIVLFPPFLWRLYVSMSRHQQGM